MKPFQTTLFYSELLISPSHHLLYYIFTYFLNLFSTHQNLTSMEVDIFVYFNQYCNSSG